MQSVNNLFPANSIYGVKYGDTRPNIIKHDMAFIGYCFSIALLVLWLIYVGSDVLYKVDNLIILCQTIYFFIFAKAVLEINLAQFYYGWRFSHFGFFPNIFKHTISPGYYEYAPLAYRLVNLDGNIARNAGFSFSVLVIFLGAYIVVVGLLALLKWWCFKPAAWRTHIIINSLLAVFELLMMNIIFFSVAELRYSDRWPVTSHSYRATCWGVAIFFIIFYSLYSLARLWFNKIAGIYCIKRFIFAVIMACVENNLVTCALYTEVAFLVFRFLIEQPATLWQIIVVVVEEVLLIVAYTVMIFSKSENTTIIIISLIVMVIFFMLWYDLIKVYTDYNNQWDYADDEREKNTQEYIGTGRLKT
jgi:hypothetical protein